jgi:hypothetical protein
VIEILPVFSETATTVEPADCSLDDPTLGQNDEAFGLIATADDFADEARHCVGQSVIEHRSGIGAVGKQLLEKRELSKQRGQKHQATIAILNIGRCDQRVQQQTQRIDQEVTLLALDQLACIKPMGVDASAPLFPRS